MILGILASVFSGLAFTEFYGYWLHILLHSNKIEFLSRSHMIHHLIDYGTNKPLRPLPVYISSARNRTNVFGIGLEWILPIGLMLTAAIAVFNCIGVHPVYQACFVASGSAWGYFMFSYMHDGMHVTGFWMDKSGWVGRWFLNARKLHDIHHMNLNDAGRMTKNFGICFFFFDRLFGSLLTEHSQFNRKGLEAALKRYAYIFAS